MCLICIDIARERLTSIEAFRNLREVWEELEEEHLGEVLGRIVDLEQIENVKKQLKDTQP